MDIPRHIREREILDTYARICKQSDTDLLDENDFTNGFTIADSSVRNSKKLESM